MSDVISVSCGYQFSIILCKHGLYSCGNSSQGGLGIGVDNNVSYHVPQKIL